jgi:mevalonate kinase
MPSTNLSPTVSVTTQAKVILAGEHFVLLGVPAIAAPVSEFQLTLRLALRSGPDLVLPDPYSGLSKEIATILNYQLQGFVRVTITSTIPQGAGLGSSAAFAVALGRALAKQASFEGSEAEERALRIANLVEESIHHRASGIDTAVVAREKVIGFQLNESGQGAVSLIDVAAPMQFMLIDSRLRRKTKDQIARVDLNRTENEWVFEKRTQAARRAVDLLTSGLGTNNTAEVAEAVSNMGALLQDLGLEPEECRAIRRLAEDHQVALKISGAGGGGVMLAFASDEARLDALEASLGERFPSHRFRLAPQQRPPQELALQVGVQI